ncbi:hypothetical protein J6590_053452 [Homalodisca vitripennis]|nr:hypothetical protein J6590_053452 [Homalodisca vitripennis]
MELSEQERIKAATHVQFGFLACQFNLVKGRYTRSIRLVSSVCQFGLSILTDAAITYTRSVWLLLLIYGAVACVIVKRRKRQLKRNQWTKDWLLNRAQYSHVNLLKELRFHPKDWHNYLRMNEETFFSPKQLYELKNSLLQELIALTTQCNVNKKNYFFKQQTRGTVAKQTPVTVRLAVKPMCQAEMMNFHHAISSNFWLELTSFEQTFAYTQSIRLVSSACRFTLLMMRGYGDRIRSYEQVRHLFNETFPDRNPISKSAVEKTIKRFEETGLVKNGPKSGRPRSARTEDHCLEVLMSVVENPHVLTTALSREVGISQGSVCKILHENCT